MRKLALLIFVAVLLMPIAPGVADQLRMLPSFNVKLAYWIHEGSSDLGEPDGTLIMLRTFAIIQADDDAYIEENRRFLIENDWDPEFVAIFDSVVQWLRDTRANNPDHFYQVSKDYRRRFREAKVKIEEVKILANLLRTMTVRWGSREIRYEIANDLLANPSANVRKRGLRILESAARDGHVSAQIDVADRYITGRGFERDLHEAYSWLLRAQCNGAGVGDRLKDLESRLPPYPELFMTVA